jgi:cobalt/nickel transport system permease protein
LRGGSQHSRIERWNQSSGQRSFIHRRHAAAKIVVVLTFLISVATLRQGSGIVCGLYFVLLLATAFAAGLPLTAVLRGAAAVLPFALSFALVTLLAGDPKQAMLLLVRAGLSSLAALLLIATTPMPELIAGLEWLKAPRFLMQIMQFLYRYLIVLVEEANAMRQAGMARAGSLRNFRFHHAAAAAGVLFARSYSRAEAIHRAMLARGFEGRLPLFDRLRFDVRDAGFATGGAAVIIGLRAALR